MNKRKIINIVFYVYNNENGTQKEACIFYNDGTEKIVSFQEAVKECKIILKERKVTSVHTVEEMYQNDDMIHVMTKNNFIKRHDEFISHEILEEDIFGDFISKKLDKVIENKESDITPIPVVPVTKEEEPVQEIKNTDTTSVEEIKDNTSDQDITDGNKVINFNKASNNKKKNKKDIFKELRVRVGSIAMAAFLAISGIAVYGCSKQQTKAGEVTNSSFLSSLLNNDKNKEEETNKKNDNTTPATDTTTKNLVEEPAAKIKATADEIGDNSKWDGKSYDELLELTHNKDQKDAMTNIRKALLYYNDTFSKAYREEGSNIRAALSFDEMVALYVAFNDLDKDAIRAIFNGEGVDSTKMGRDYRSAYLQLLGALIISDSKTPVDLSMLITTEKGKEQYQKYITMFYEIKDAEGKERVELVEKYYAELRKDYPLKQEEITDGIAHADEYDFVDCSMLPVVIITSALETTEQIDIEKDRTLSTVEMELSKDVGGCQLAYSEYDKVEAISNAAETDKTSPKIQQYRTAINKYLDEHNINVPENEDDRDLSKLEIFKKNVNPKGYEDVYEYHKRVIETTTTREEKKTWTEEHTEVTKVETEVREEDIPESEKEKIDREIKEENNKARKEANQEADKIQQEMQREEDEKAKIIQEEIKESEKDFHKKEDNANNTINDNNKDTNPENDKRVNESDFGEHNVKFEEEDSNQNGDLNDSVKNITTDSSNDQTDNDFPSPEDTEATFEERVPKREAPQQEQQTEQQQSVEENHQEQPKQEEHQEEPKQEEKHEEPKQEEHHEEPKQEEKHEEPKQEEHHEEPKHEEPKQEEHHEEPKHEEPKQEEQHQQTSSQPASKPEPVKVEVDENSWYEYEIPEDNKVSKVDYRKIYEKAVDEYFALLDQQQNSETRERESYVYKLLT